MPKKLKAFLKYFLPTLILGSAFFYFKTGVVDENFGKKPKHQHTDKQHDDSHHDHHDHNTTDHSPHSVTSAVASSKITKFSYGQELEKVRQLAGELPKSRTQMLRMIISEDPYKNEQKPVEPHSIDEIKQQQRGAIKVIALRSLVSQKDDKQVVSDLDYIIQNAKDPTIKKIAQAALNSFNKGRPFFDDFLDGLSSL